MAPMTSFLPLLLLAAQPGPPCGLFPAPEQCLQKVNSEAGRRAHAWGVAEYLFKSAPFDKCKSVPRWFTFTTRDEALDLNTSTGLGPCSPLGVGKLNQVPKTLTGATDQEAYDFPRKLTALTLFNQAIVDRLRLKQGDGFELRWLALEGGAYDPEKAKPARTRLRELLKAKPAARTIPPFSRESIALKAVWWPLTREYGYKVPVPPSFAGHKPGQAHSPKEWKTWHQIDFRNRKRYCKETYAPPSLGKIPIETLYVIQLCKEEWVTAMKDRVGNVDLKIGDYVVLLGLHFATRELEDWIWGTIWWNPDPQTAKPEHAQGRTPYWQSSYLKNYLLDVSFGFQPSRVMFNPFLEASVADGVQSNCVQCHRKAAWPDGDKSVPHKPIRPGDPMFRSRIRTEFLWSLVP